QIDNTFAEFVKQYGGLPGQGFQATVNQALFVENGNTLDGWLKPRGGNLLARLTKAEDVTALADDLYLAAFFRLASENEKRDVATFLKDRSDRSAAVGELVWALLTSSEFRFNH